MSSVRVSSRSPPKSDFFSLLGACRRGLKSPTAAAITMRSADFACRSTAARMSAALTTSCRSTPRGVGSSTGPATSSTSAPLRAASCARAKPMRPLDRLLMKRIGSSASRVGPAVTRTRRPARSPQCRESSISRTRTSRSTSRPTPISPEASAPTEGPRIVTPRARESRRVRLHRRLHPHRRVHRGSDDDRALEAERRSGQEIIGQAQRELPQRMRGRRSDTQHLRPPGRFDMQLVPRVRGLEVLLAVYPLGAQDLERQRGDEGLGPAGQRAADLVPRTLEPSHQIGGLVSGDPATDAQQDAHDDQASAAASSVALSVSSTSGAGP